MVRAEGFEPPRLASREPKSRASTSSATPAGTQPGLHAAAMPPPEPDPAARRSAGATSVKPPPLRNTGAMASERREMRRREIPPGTAAGLPQARQPGGGLYHAVQPAQQENGRSSRCGSLAFPAAGPASRALRAGLLFRPFSAFRRRARGRIGCVATVVPGPPSALRYLRCLRAGLSRIQPPCDPPPGHSFAGTHPAAAPDGVPPGASDRAKRATTPEDAVGSSRAPGRAGLLATLTPGNSFSGKRPAAAPDGVPPGPSDRAEAGHHAGRCRRPSPGSNRSQPPRPSPEPQLCRHAPCRRAGWRPAGPQRSR